MNPPRSHQSPMGAAAKSAMSKFEKVVERINAEFDETGCMNPALANDIWRDEHGAVPA